MKDYLPSPEEIRERSEIMRWMEGQGWNDDFIVSVMIRDNPTIETVKRMVAAYGPKVAYSNMMAMTCPIEFDFMHMKPRGR